MNLQFRTTGIEQDPTYNFECELKIRGFSRRTIKAYLHYNIKLLNFVRQILLEINFSGPKGNRTPILRLKT